MAKKPKWLNSPERDVPQHIRNAKTAGRGTSDAAHDAAFWLGEDTASIDHWIAALEAIDKRNDKEPLITLLKSETDLPHQARLHLAHLLARYQIKRKPGTQATPSYSRTEAQIALMVAADQVRNLVSTGINVESALDHVSNARGIPFDILKLHYSGRLGSTNRMKKHRP